MLVAKTEAHCVGQAGDRKVATRAQLEVERKQRIASIFPEWYLKFEAQKAS